MNLINRRRGLTGQPGRLRLAGRFPASSSEAFAFCAGRIMSASSALGRTLVPCKARLISVGREAIWEQVHALPNSSHGNSDLASYCKSLGIATHSSGGRARRPLHELKGSVLAAVPNKHVSSGDIVLAGIQGAEERL